MITSMIQHTSNVKFDIFDFVSKFWSVVNIDFEFTPKSCTYVLYILLYNVPVGKLQFFKFNILHNILLCTKYYYVCHNDSN